MKRLYYTQMVQMEKIIGEEICCLEAGDFVSDVKMEWKGTWGSRWENETLRNMQAIEEKAIVMKGKMEKKYVRQRGKVNASQWS